MHSSDSAYDLPPFPAFPSIERFLGVGSVQDAVDRIERSIQARDAISVVIGPPGTGKTLISELLASRHQDTHRVISLGETPLADSDSFLRRVLHQAGANLHNVPGGDLQLALFDHICLGDQSDLRLLLLIDEAQSLNPELLETIRTLTNLKRDGIPRVSVVMFGGNHLDELLIAPSMDGFRQRISTRCYLHPFNNEETNWYINQTILNCGCDPEATITPDAISAVHHACSGVPRLINQLLTHAIDYAADKDEHLITDRIIDQSWAEVQQLPSPMVDEPEINIAASTVEFGELDAFDAPAENQDAIKASDGMFTPTWVDTETGTKTFDAGIDASTNANTDASIDLNDPYAFTQESELVIAAEHDDPAALQPGPNQQAPPATDLPTEVWGDEDELVLQEGLAESIVQEHTVPTSDAIDNAPPNIDELGSTQLEYPQLASPALASDSDLNADYLNAVVPGSFETTQTNEELFGSFDEEEEIDLRAATTPAERALKGSAATVETVLPQDVVLHDETLDITELARFTEDDQIQYCDDAHQMPLKMHFEANTNSSHGISFADAQDTNPDASVDSATLDFASEHHGVTMQFDAAEQHADSHKHTSDPVQHESEMKQHRQRIPMHHDDSDILIIEDEVDFHRIDQRQTSTNRSYHSTDYQRMLKRMRSTG